MASSETNFPVGQAASLSGHFGTPVVVEDARRLGDEFECRVRRLVDVHKPIRQQAPRINILASAGLVSQTTNQNSPIPRNLAKSPRPDFLSAVPSRSDGRNGKTERMGRRLA